MHVYYVYIQEYKICQNLLSNYIYIESHTRLLHSLFRSGGILVPLCSLCLPAVHTFVDSHIGTRSQSRRSGRGTRCRAHTQYEQMARRPALSDKWKRTCQLVARLQTTMNELKTVSMFCCFYLSPWFDVRFHLRWPLRLLTTGLFGAEKTTDYNMRHLDKSLQYTWSSSNQDLENN